MSVASIRRPTDCLARLANKIIREREIAARHGLTKQADLLIRFYAREAESIARGFYQRQRERRQGGTR